MNIIIEEYMQELISSKQLTTQGVKVVWPIEATQTQIYALLNWVAIAYGIKIAACSAPSHHSN